MIKKRDKSVIENSEQLARLASIVGKKKGQKYRNQKTTVDGIKFDSKKEAERWPMLKMLQDAKQISRLERQRKFKITVNGVKICAYIADFVYREHEICEYKKWHLVIEDCKGFRTPVYKLKKRLMKAVHGIEIREI